jgi:hypothetical protein
VTVHYDLAPGTRALDINNSGVSCKKDEHELLIGPHQTFVVVSDELEAGKRVIRLQSATPELAGRPAPPAETRSVAPGDVTPVTAA